MFLLLDIGGTHIRACLSDGETLLRKEVIDTPQSFEDALRALSELKDTLEIDRPLARTICGITGVLEKEKDELFVSPNLPDWEHKSLKSNFEDIWKSDVFLENDASLAGLGEAVYGAGKDANIVMYYTIGTGVGGARIVNKEIDSRVYGFEPGRQIIDSKNAFEKEGNKLEDFVGGSSITKINEKVPSEITDQGFWNTVEKELAVGMYNSILHWSPEIIVLGGGLVNQDIISLTNLTQNITKLNTMYPTIPSIKKSKLGDESGLYGALSLTSISND